MPLWHVTLKPDKGRRFEYMVFHEAIYKDPLSDEPQIDQGAIDEKVGAMAVAEMEAQNPDRSYAVIKVEEKPAERAEDV